MMKLKIIGAFAVALASFTGSAMPTLNFDAGVLQGINGISFNGVEYNTRFADGLCTDLYAGCENNRPERFEPANTVAIAIGIVNEMIAALNAASFQYSGNIEGCSDAGSCDAYLVYGDGVSGSYEARTLVVAAPNTFSSRNDNFGSFDSSVDGAAGSYIVAELAVVVPAPASLLLLAFGLIGMRRR